MKELTIKEKAKRYDERLEKAREEYENHKSFKVFCGKLVHIFPELKESEESEDEKMRKELIMAFKSLNQVKNWNGIERTKILAWLEKQCEPTDINPSEFDLRLNKLLKQFENLPKEELESSLSFYLNVVQNDGTYIEEQQGEQKPVIEMKSPEESLGVDSDTYNKIVDECIYGEQKPAEWSAEDEEYLNFVIATMKTLQVKCTENEIKRHSNSQAAPYYGKVIDWLKSIKDRVQPKQKWSEEDEVAVKDICDKLNRMSMTYVGKESIVCQEDIKLLKSLRPQKSWKPSERQKEALLWCVVHLGGADKQTLGELLEELNKL